MLRAPSGLRDQCTLLFFSLVVLYAATASYAAQSIDTVSMYLPAWQLAHHGNITMDAFADQPLWFVEAEGRTVSARFPGATWLATPLYTVGRTETPMPGMGNLTAAAASAAAVVLLYLLCRRLTTPRQALAASLVLALATPTWSVSADALWTHGPGQMWLLLGVLLASSGRPLAAGFAFGAALLTRPHYAVVAVVIAAFELHRTRRWSPFVLLGGGTAVGLLVLLAYNLRIFGHFGVRTGYSDGMAAWGGVGANAFLSNVAGTLVSPARGVLLLSPFLIMLLPGLPSAWRHAPSWVRAAAAGGMLYMVLQLWMNRWPGGHGFYTYRLALEWLTLSAPLLLLAYRRWAALTPLRRRVFSATVFYSAVTQALGAAWYSGESSEPDYWRTWPPGEVAASHPVAAALLVSGALLALVLPRIVTSRQRYEYERQTHHGEQGAAEVPRESHDVLMQRHQQEDLQQDGGSERRPPASAEVREGEKQPSDQQ